MALENKEQKNEKQKEVEESTTEIVTIGSKADGINVLEGNAIHTKRNPTNETQDTSTKIPNSPGVVEEVKTPKDTILVDAKKRTTLYPMSGGVHRFILQRGMVSWKVNNLVNLEKLIL